MIKVAVNGALGKMGQEVVRAVNEQPDMQLVLELDAKDDLDKVLSQSQVDVLIDFTRPEARMNVVRTILQHKVSGVIGTTGFTPDDLDEIAKLSEKNKTGIIIAPNFTIGCVLMMQFAKQAAKYFDTAEIIEYHHNQKADYPSGTAVKTAQLMTEARKEGFNSQLGDKVANVEGARGGVMDGIRMHSIRLPGMVAHQEVIFGEKGQYMTLRHDAVSREAYMPGVLLAIREIVKMKKLVYGLETLLNLD